MGSIQIRGSCHKNRNMIIPLLFILVSSLSQVKLVAQGRGIFQNIEAAQNAQKAGNEEMVMVRAQLTGSRPPRCEFKCNSCGHCKAIQVPIQLHTLASTKGDDITNYKPLSWKCKCGDSIFSP